MGPKIRCKKCKDIIQSAHTHDFVWCKCKSVAIDGGDDYLRLTGSMADIEVIKQDEEKK